MAIVRQGIESILFPKEQRRPLSSFSSVLLLLLVNRGDIYQDCWHNFSLAASNFIVWSEISSYIVFIGPRASFHNQKISLKTVFSRHQ